MARIDKLGALQILAYARTVQDQDFHTLSSAQVDIILAHADLHGYRKPANANGSRGRYFYQHIQRIAQKVEKD